MINPYSTYFSFLSVLVYLGPLEALSHSQSRADLDFGNQGAMNRTNVGDLQESMPLVVGEITNEGDLCFDSIEHPLLGIALSTILGVDSRVRQAHLHALKRPLFPLGIHSNSHAGARSQGGQEQLIRIGTLIIAADIAWFVRLK
jgi:hypothetical protein